MSRHPARSRGNQAQGCHATEAGGGSADSGSVQHESGDPHLLAVRRRREPDRDAPCPTAVSARTACEGAGSFGLDGDGVARGVSVYVYREIVEATDR